MGAYDNENLTPEQRHLAEQYNSDLNNAQAQQKTSEEKIADYQKHIDKLYELFDIVNDYEDEIEDLCDKVEKVYDRRYTLFQEWEGVHKDTYESFISGHYAAYEKYCDDIDDLSSKISDKIRDMEIKKAEEEGYFEELTCIISTIKNWFRKLTN